MSVSTNAETNREQRRATPAVPTWRDAWREATARRLGHLTGTGRVWSFRRRRIVSATVVLLAWVLLAWLVGKFDAAFLRPSFLTGWTLLACLVALTAIGVRRRLPILPLGSVSTWMQIHLYTGFFAIGVFVLHTPHLWPHVLPFSASTGSLSGWSVGWFEGALAVLFTLVSASGVYGLFASRRLPPRLTAIDAPYRFDQVGWHREQIAETATAKIATLQGQATVNVLGDFYNKHMKAYLRTRPSWAFLAMPRSNRRRQLLRGLTQLDRYLDQEGRTVAGQLAGLVRRRDDLDYQYALQLRLRLWVVVHATLSLALLVMAVLHGILATRFVQV